MNTFMDSINGIIILTDYTSETFAEPHEDDTFKYTKIFGVETEGAIFETFSASRKPEGCHRF